MVFPPGQGKSGERLMQLWRDYLEQYAAGEGDVRKQIVVASYHAVEVFGAFSSMLDRDGRRRALINRTISRFEQDQNQGDNLEDCLDNAAFALYGHLNALSHEFAEGHEDAESLIEDIDNQVRANMRNPGKAARSAAALQSAFPLLSLITMVLDQDEEMISVIRQVDQRFASCAAACTTDWERLVNALYRLVEMMQLFAVLTDDELKDQVNQIATRFQEEDQTVDLLFKLRNGFCRLFELAHLVTTHLDEIL
jgi:hypothetical protein